MRVNIPIPWMRWETRNARNKKTPTFEHRLRNHERIGPFADAVGMEGQHWNGRQFFWKVQKWRDRTPPNKLKRWRCRSIIKYLGFHSCQSMLFTFGVVTFHWTNSMPLKIGLVQRKIVFQPSMNTSTKPIMRKEKTTNLIGKKSSRITRNIEQHRRMSKSSKSIS